MKKLMVAMILALGAFSVFAGTGVPGLYQKIYSGKDVTTGDPADGGDIIAAGAGLLAVAAGNPSISYTDPNTSTIYTLAGNQTVGYKGVMMMTKGKTYTFVKNFDDSGHVRIISPDGVTTNAVLDSASWTDTKYGSFTPDTTDFYGILLYFGNGSSVVGPAAEPFKSAPYAGLMWNDVGLTTCTSANKSQWHRLINNDDDLGEYLYTDLPDPDCPDVANIVATVSSAGSATISFVLTAGKADLSVEVTDSDGVVKSAVVGSGISASETVLSATVTGLELSRSYTVKVCAETTFKVYSFSGSSFYHGEVSVTAGDNADSETLTPGTFVISRAGGAASTWRPVEVAFSGFGAVKATHYAMVSEKVVIPAGATSVKVKVWPLQYGAGNQNLTLTLTPNLGYLVGTAAATIAIQGSEVTRPVRFLSTTGDDANDGLSVEHAFRTLQCALDDVKELDSSLIYVVPGKYETTARNAITNLGKSEYLITNAVTIVGMGNTPEDAHFKGTGTSKDPARVFYMNNAESKLKNLLVSSGYVTGSTASDGGADILMHTNGGIVEDCVVSNGWCAAWQAGGGGIMMWTGRVLRTKFTCNGGNNQKYNYNGAHLCMRGGYAENCLFTKSDEGTTIKSYGTIQLCGSSVLSSCTIAGNHAKAVTGIMLEGKNCRVYNSAIFANKVDSDATGHDAVYVLTGANIEQFVNCASDIQLGSTCVLASSAGFVDEASYDFHLGASSVCRDAADESYYTTPQVESATDLDGNLRLSGPKRGEGLDIGCYEFDVTALSVDVTVDNPIGLMEYDNGLQPATASFHVLKNGGSGTATYSWDFENDGTVDLVSSDADVTHDYPAIGVYTVSLTAVDDSGSVSVKKTAIFSTAPKTIYVDASSANPTAPYVTRATAARTVSAAYAHTLDGTRILVAPGQYLYSSQAARLNIQRAVRISGEGLTPDDVVFTNDVYTLSSPGEGLFFQLQNAGAFLENMLFVDGMAKDLYAGAGGIIIAPGVVSNCVIRHCGSVNSNTRAGGVVINGGLLTHSIVEDCYLAIPTGRKFQGVYVTSIGRIENCLLRNMHSHSSIVCLDGSSTSMRNCTIVDCTVSYSTGNNFTGTTVAERFDGSAIDVTSGDYSRAGQCGKVYNTVVANVGRISYESYKSGGSGVVITNVLPATNCANWKITYVYNNWIFPDTIHVFNNCATEDPQPINDTCFTGTAQDFFDNYAAGNLRPRLGGALYNHGITQPGQSDMTDLAGRPRVFGRTVDIGAFEGRTGFKVILR